MAKLLTFRWSLGSLKEICVLLVLLYPWLRDSAVLERLSHPFPSVWLAADYRAGGVNNFNSVYFFVVLLKSKICWQINEQNLVFFKGGLMFDGWNQLWHEIFGLIIFKVSFCMNTRLINPFSLLLMQYMRKSVETGYRAVSVHEWGSGSRAFAGPPQDINQNLLSRGQCAAILGIHTNQRPEMGYSEILYVCNRVPDEQR